MPEVSFEQTTPKSSSSLKPIIVALGMFALVGTSAYVGFWYGKQQVPPPAPAPKVTTPPVAEVPEATPPAEVDETAGWKVYTNDVYKYSLKYPAAWVVDAPEITGSEAANNESAVHPENSQYPTGYFRVTSWTDSKTITEAEKWFNDAKNITLKWTWEDQAISDVSVGGLLGWQVSGNLDSGQGVANPAVHIIVRKGTVVYEIDYRDAASLEFLPTFKKILSAFKFLE